jgi:hypothetical protein
MSISELAALTKDSKVVTDRYIAEVSGVVSGLYNTEYGNFYLTDPETKAQILVYGIVKANAEKFKYSDDTLGHYIADVIFVKDGEDKYISNDKSFASLGISEGDYITIRAMVITYNGKAQLQGEFVSLDLDTSKVGGFISTYNGSSVCVLHNTSKEAITIDLATLDAKTFNTLCVYVGLNDAKLDGTSLTIGGQTSVVLK